MTLIEFYKKTEADHNEVIRRLVNEKMVIKYLKKFLSDEHYAKLKHAVSENDIETAYRCAHTLKGLCLTLGFGRLGVPVAAFTEELRSGNAENSQAYLSKTDPLYDELIQWIRELDA